MIARRLTFSIFLYLFFFSCQAPSNTSQPEIAQNEPSVAGEGGEIYTESFYPEDSLLWRGVEDEAEFIRVISDREELGVEAIEVGEKPIFEEQSDILVKNFNLKKESENENFTEFSGNDFMMIAQEGKTYKLAFKEFRQVSLEGLLLEDLTLDEFKNRYPKAYQVRNFGTKSDSKLIIKGPDSLPSSLDYSFLYLKNKAELRLFWIEGSLIEAYLIFGQQQRG